MFCLYGFIIWVLVKTPLYWFEKGCFFLVVSVASVGPPPRACVDVRMDIFAQTHQIIQKPTTRLTRPWRRYAQKRTTFFYTASDTQLELCTEMHLDMDGPCQKHRNFYDAICTETHLGHFSQTLIFADCITLSRGTHRMHHLTKKGKRV